MKTYNDVFVEELVVRQRPVFVTLIRLGTVLLGIVLTIAFYFLTGWFLGSYGSALFPALFALVCIGVFMVFRYSGLEYEYSFYSGDVDIDRIRGKRRRKRMMSFNCRDIDLMAPYSEKYESTIAGNFAHKLDARGSGQGMRDWIILINSANGERSVLAISPSDRMINAFRQFTRRDKFKED